MASDAGTEILQTNGDATLDENGDALLSDGESDCDCCPGCCGAAVSQPHAKIEFFSPTGVYGGCINVTWDSFHDEPDACVYIWNFFVFAQLVVYKCKSGGHWCAFFDGSVREYGLLTCPCTDDIDDFDYLGNNFHGRGEDTGATLTCTAGVLGGTLTIHAFSGSGAYVVITLNAMC